MLCEEDLLQDCDQPLTVFPSPIIRGETWIVDNPFHNALHLTYSPTGSLNSPKTSLSTCVISPTVA